MKIPNTKGSKATLHHDAAPRHASWWGWCSWGHRQYPVPPYMPSFVLVKKFYFTFVRPYNPFPKLISFVHVFFNWQMLSGSWHVYCEKRSFARTVKTNASTVQFPNNSFLADLHSMRCQFTLKVNTNSQGVINQSPYVACNAEDNPWAYAELQLLAGWRFAPVTWSLKTIGPNVEKRTLTRSAITL